MRRFLKVMLLGLGISLFIFVLISCVIAVFFFILAGFSNVLTAIFGRSVMFYIALMSPFILILFYVVGSMVVDSV